VGPAGRADSHRPRGRGDSGRIRDGTRIATRAGHIWLRNHLSQPDRDIERLRAWFPEKPPPGSLKHRRRSPVRGRQTGSHQVGGAKPVAARLVVALRRTNRAARRKAGAWGRIFPKRMASPDVRHRYFVARCGRNAFGRKDLERHLSYCSGSRQTSIRPVVSESRPQVIQVAAEQGRTPAPLSTSPLSGRPARSASGCFRPDTASRSSPASRRRSARPRHPQAPDLRVQVRVHLVHEHRLLGAWRTAEERPECG
jgi:hypothetical protein